METKNNEMEIFEDDEFECLELLNRLGESTGDYYLYFNCKTQTVTFSENICNTFDLFSQGQTSCTLEKWRSIMDENDAHKMRKLEGQLLNTVGKSYNLNYRMTNRYNQHIWVNSRGKTYAGEDGKVAYVLGRISTQFSQERPMPSEGFHHAELKQALKRMRDAQEQGFLMLVGIDDLKIINIKYGWETGDAIIQSLSEAMAQILPHMEKIFRLNSDVFAALLPYSSVDDIKDVFNKLQEYMHGQCNVSGGCVAIRDYQAPDANGLLQYAETSLDSAKASGKNRLSFFSPEDYEKKLVALELRDDLEDAIEKNFEGFFLVYQAQIRSESYDVVGAEALLRFKSSKRGTISPTEFIPILEQSEMIYNVGMWVIREALDQCRRWRKLQPDFHMSINMSYVQLACAEVEMDVVQALRESGLPGSALTIEVTESMQLTNYPYLNDVFRTWKREGIQISIDDFGTGYSNLQRLKEMEIDEIKIDRCFITGIQSNVYNYRLVSNMVELADSCQMRICCEGVETIEELSTLENLRPSLYQGFLFAKPCASQEFDLTGTEWRSKVGEFAAIERMLKDLSRNHEGKVSLTGTEEALYAKAILDEEEEIFYLSDMDTYEMYYLNPAGQRLVGVRDYQGRKCYKVLHGFDAPCEFCTNARIRKNSFYTWEHKNSYCGRRFLLRDKFISYMGKNLRMEVAMDITKNEWVSQATGERLEFANKIVGYLETFSTYSNYKEAVQQVLASVGQFYRADRAYFFERNFEDENYWDNTFEWCDRNVLSQKANLQHVAPKALERWMQRFEDDKSVIILNLESLKDSSPIEWEILAHQNIRRLIAVPLRNKGRIFGFVGVDNPRYAIFDDSQMRVLACFLLARIREDQNERRYQMLVGENNNEILEALKVGSWSIDINLKDGHKEMEGDNIFRQILGLGANLSSRERYNEWHARICLEDQENVDQFLRRICHRQERETMEYVWKHPQKGEVCVRFRGSCIQKTSQYARLEGYCSILEEKLIPIPRKKKVLLRAEGQP